MEIQFHIVSWRTTFLNSGCTTPLIQAGFQPASSFIVSLLVVVEFIESVKVFLRWEGRTCWTSTDQFSHAYPLSQEKYLLLAHVFWNGVAEGWHPSACWSKQLQCLTDMSGPLCLCKSVFTRAVRLIYLEPIGILVWEYLICGLQSRVWGFHKAYQKIKFILQLPTWATHRKVMSSNKIHTKTGSANPRSLTFAVLHIWVGISLSFE